MKSLLHKLSLYNNWANQKIFTQFSQLEDKTPATSMHFLCHVMNAQTVWLSRITGQQSSVRTWDDHSLDVCMEMQQQTHEMLKHLTTAEVDLQQLISYTTFNGLSFENSIYDILIHVFNHGTYHRAQIAQDMRKNGLEPVNTDYIAFVR
ncbi:DinB family protein [Pedobacter immunditicola]|uniref:DinB family protein n=1 Tax=Pedobacter immunditicola TaxID=3133440 RepID=UPI0030A4039E